MIGCWGLALGPRSPEPQTPSPEVSPAEQPQPTASSASGEQPTDAIPQAASPAENAQELPPAAATAALDTFSAPEVPQEAPAQRPTWAEVREAHQVSAWPLGEAHVNSPEFPTSQAGNQSAEPLVLPGQEAESMTSEAQNTAAGVDEPSSHHDATANIPAANIPEPEVSIPAENLAESPLELPLAAEAQTPAPPASEIVQPTVAEPKTDEPASPDLSTVSGATPDSILHFPTSPAALADPFVEESFTQSDDDLISDQPASLEGDAALQPEEEAELQRLVPRARVLRRSQP
ncbi:MAG: hypothetical protein HC929_10670 [Leptolyngbyaceae cyanobacterium SM2_5_2]|nr:hypothetical protein [Leptolyngbyaceae cyanobacterium SM2_5_2]